MYIIISCVLIKKITLGRAKFEVYIRHGKKPTDEDYDRKFLLPHDLWDVDVADDRFKIFVPESQLDKTGLYYIGIRDIC